jgi:cytochrome c-type biogenesis protein CcmH
MRRVVREELATGASDAEVIERIRANYGDYVLLKPPVQTNTYVLWFFPALFVLISLIWFVLRQKGEAEPIALDALSDSDETLLKSLMDEKP